MTELSPCRAHGHTGDAPGPRPDRASCPEPADIGRPTISLAGCAAQGSDGQPPRRREL